MLKRGGLLTAGERESGLLVVAKTITPGESTSESNNCNNVDRIRTACE